MVERQQNIYVQIKMISDLDFFLQQNVFIFQKKNYISIYGILIIIGLRDDTDVIL